MAFEVKAKPKTVVMAKVIHADGSVTDLGVLKKRNPLSRFVHKVAMALRRSNANE